MSEPVTSAPDNHYTSEEGKERFDSIPTITSSPAGGNEVAGEIKPHMFMELSELEHKPQQFHRKICRLHIENVLMVGLTDKDPVSALAARKGTACGQQPLTSQHRKCGRGF